MSHLCWLDGIRSADRAWAGEKAANLGELIHAGLNVPRGFCLTASAYSDTLAATGLDARLAARLSATDIDDPVDLEQAAEEIRAWIESAGVDPSTAQQVREAIAQLKSAPRANLFAVRASRVFDDVPNPAASGLQQAYLAVPGGQVTEHVVKCWGIPWTSRAIYYRSRKRIDQTRLTIAVVVQPMIAADAAGVMFTANPLNGAAGEIHIDAIWGLGNTVVQARRRPDHFVVAKTNRAIVDRAIAEKDVMDISAGEGGLQTVALPPDKRLAASLSDDQVTALAALGQQVERLFGSPQDIEWCVAGGEMYLLQTRPLKG